MSGDWLGIVWLVLLLMGNAFFVGAEFAVISARRSQIEPLAEAGSRAARTTLWAMEHATMMLATTQLGITICSLLILNVSEPSIHHLLEGPLGLTGLSPELVSVVGFVITLVLVSFLHVVFGEMVPKNISFSLPDRAALMLAPPLVAIARVLHVVVVSLNWSANTVLRAFKVEPKDEAASAFTVDEVANIVAQSRREGTLTDASGTVQAAFEFTEKKVSDVAVPMPGLVTLPEDATPSDVERAVAQNGFSRYVLVDDQGDPTGYLHLKDVLDLDDDEFGDPVPPKRIRQLISIYRGTDLEDALATMRRSGVHVARSFDEYGTTEGVLFLEDILEELIGEVQDATRRGR
ncbi:hemolysin family protein [Frigoribacterium sp. CFBP9039]|uniref:hemolysin family protein n=1 Tax=unclassified Frigoribacterium TaxID=2627005 RepID=UPI00177EE024|nr:MULTISPECIES: hemolysin family protein [unclassified Frigoribacterium]MBD8702324.1 HlyC/CorC family transporter [Frigoribacterium sp. CFBP 13712]MDY0891398.1 hemolysin family protein [Frigoribacterium sp. CFBP9030]MDY0946771.1 hemolysin family protein [Frigoribacterium sp. CFBP9039]